MSACEYCWARAQLLGIDYYKAMTMAEDEKRPCTTDTLEGAKARAGQFWDEEKQCDRRLYVEERAAADRSHKEGA